jgi:PS-10 peptidase S37
MHARVLLLLGGSCALGWLVSACGSTDDSGTMTSGGPGASSVATGGAGRGGAGGATTAGSGGQGTGGASSGGAAGSGTGGGGSSVGGASGAAGSGGSGGSVDAGRPDGSGSTDGGGAGDGGIDGSAGMCPDPPKPTCAATDLAGKLRCIPGLTLKTSPAPPQGYQRFDIDLEQPVDHANPNGAKFKQRLVLLHKSQAAPLVLFTTGYGLSTGQSEVTTTFAANQISIEHRYFSPSIPEAPIPWENLTIAQAAADSHHIWESFKWLYSGKWANSGGSKGGETAVYHRRFHPCDVDATVAYVAPLVLGLDDQRFVTFLDNVGGATYATCRTKLVDVSKALLTRRDEVLPLLDASKFTHLGKDMSYEHAVQDLIFAFWQYQPASRCNSIPAPTASPNAFYTFMSDLGLLDNADDASFDYFAPYYWQSGLELGLPANYDAPIMSLLKFPGSYTLEAYLPMNVHPVFRPAAMPDVQNWVKTSAQRMMFIYGEFDPWSAAAYDLGNATDSLKFIAPANNHGSGIADLRAADKEKALSTLERWLGVMRAPSPVPATPHEGERKFLRR